MPESSNALEFGSTALFKSGLWTQLVNSKIPIVMVPSLDDTVVFPVVPQCPYEKAGRTAETLSYAGNPSVLEVGDHTGVVETDDGYYIIRLTSDDSDTVYETAVEEAVSLAVSEAFYEKYNEIRDGYQVVVNSEVWDGLPFGEITLESTGA